MDFKDNGLTAWEENAEFWDEQMGDNSNYFHCDIVRPNVEKLLGINETDLVLDVACGNGNFSQRMAKQGATVVAFDYT
ncbi:MAG: class I SAM-dependent methyltransferase, partial [Eubacteriales bacterium]